MPLGIITSDQLQKEVNSLSRTNLDNIKIIDIRRGRGNTLQIPESLREVIAEEAIESGHTKELAEVFGVSKSSVDAYKNGATSTSSYHEESHLTPVIESKHKELSDKARVKLGDALEALTSEKIGEAKAKDIAAIAKDMSVIVKNMEPEGPSVQNNTQVIIYRPRVHDEEEYDVITVNE